MYLDPQCGVDSLVKADSWDSLPGRRLGSWLILESDTGHVELMGSLRFLVSFLLHQILSLWP